MYMILFFVFWVFFSEGNIFFKLAKFCRNRKTIYFKDLCYIKSRSRISPKVMIKPSKKSSALTYDFYCLKCLTIILISIIIDTIVKINSTREVLLFEIRQQQRKRP